MKDSPIGRPSTGSNYEPMKPVMVKLPRSVVDAVERRAHAEDRAVSAYLRRMITGIVQREDEAVAR
jgi:hypothetical protein